MALLLPRSIFIHVPKTGGEWVRAAVARAAIPTREIGGLHAHGRCGHALSVQCQCPVCAHTPFSLLDARGLFTFAFVRHPLSYYQSYWAYKMSKGWDERNNTDIHVQSDDFTTFVRNMMAYHGPGGWVSRVYRRYLYRGKAGVDFIGRQERLAGDLVRALHVAGERFDENLLRSTPPVNRVSRRLLWRRRCRYSNPLRCDVIAYEKHAMEAFGYETDVRFWQLRPAPVSL